MKNLITRLVSEEDGATMVEYALMVALIAVAAIAGVRLLGTNILNRFNTVAGDISGGTGG